MKKASVGKAGVFGFHLVGICAFFAPDENSYAMFRNELNDHKTIFSDTVAQNFKTSVTLSPEDEHS